MSDVAHKSHKLEYFVVFGLLAFLTVVELLVPDMDMSSMKKGISLCVLAGGKAFLVAYFYMHLKEERPWLKFIAGIPIIAGFYALVLVLEAMVR